MARGRMPSVGTLAQPPTAKAKAQEFEKLLCSPSVTTSVISVLPLFVPLVNLRHIVGYKINIASQQHANASDPNAKASKATRHDMISGYPEMQLKHNQKQRNTKPQDT